MAKKTFEIGDRFSTTATKRADQMKEDVIHKILTGESAKVKADTYRTSLILERSLMEKIKIMAFKEGSTITELISQIMRDSITSYEKKNGILER